MAESFIRDGTRRKEKGNNEEQPSPKPQAGYADVVAALLFAKWTEYWPFVVLAILAVFFLVTMPLVRSR
jgi:hypothetical protein